jgi:hypothetical protein
MHPANVCRAVKKWERELFFPTRKPRPEPLGEHVRRKDITPGNEASYLQALEMLIGQIDLEIDTCSQLCGTEPRKLLAMLGKAIAREKSHSGGGVQ